MDKAGTLQMLKDAGVTQLDIASALKMSPATIRHYLNDKPISRRCKADLERYFGELRSKRSDPRDGGPEAA